MGGFCINVCKIKERNKGGYIFVPIFIYRYTPGVYSLYRFYKWIGLLGGPVGWGRMFVGCICVYRAEDCRDRGRIVSLCKKVSYVG